MVLCCDCFVVVCVMMYGVVFFFKQKTAYEMRISDWSSDVCSSDLMYGQFGLPDLGPRGAGYALSASSLAMVFVYAAQYRRTPRLHVLREIGRASCRERVCQYV